jgi:hypothetical protein
MKKTLLSLIYLSLTLSFYGSSHAEQVNIPGHSAVDGSFEMPQRGDSMDTIRVKFGNPNKELFPVGNPPITQWEYDGFIVFFEHQYAIHAINVETLILPTYN